MKFFRLWLVRVFVLALALLVARMAQAHPVPSSYLRMSLEGNTLEVRWSFPFEELAKQKAEPGPLSHDALLDDALSRLVIKADDSVYVLQRDTQGRVSRERTDPDNPVWRRIPTAVDASAQGPDLVRELTIDCSQIISAVPEVEVFVHLFANGETYTTVVSQKAPFATIQLLKHVPAGPDQSAGQGQATESSGGETELVVAQPDRFQQFKDYLREGVWHIWVGYDHILFLVTLLLTAAFILSHQGAHGREWIPRGDLKSTFVQATKIVTSFTLAHSITLSLVIFGIVSLPARLVESTIALSIAIAAANNLYPIMHKRLWLLTFFFGLIHGMGFAGALEELGLPDRARWIALVAFNVGVEGGQLAIVAVILPVIYGLSHVKAYRTIALPALSGVVILLALLWFVQRAFDFALFDIAFLQ